MKLKRLAEREVALKIKNRAQAGFTLIELIIVIVILGILSVVAAPRFIDFSDDANDATTVAKKAAFQAGLKLLNAKYEIKQTTPIVIGGKSVNFNSEGWPTGSTTDSSGCADLWNKVFADPESITVAATYTSTLVEGWNAFAYNNVCGYIKSAGGDLVYTSSAPHFVYYMGDLDIDTGVYHYVGKGGDVKIYGM